jgi:hypothetical protein
VLGPLLLLLLLPPQGQVVFTGGSSLDIRMELLQVSVSETEVAFQNQSTLCGLHRINVDGPHTDPPLHLQQEPHAPEPSLIALFSFVLLDPATRRPAPVPPLLPQTPQVNGCACAVVRPGCGGCSGYHTHTQHVCTAASLQEHAWAEERAALAAQRKAARQASKAQGGKLHCERVCIVLCRDSCVVCSTRRMQTRWAFGLCLLHPRASPSCNATPCLCAVSPERQAYLDSAVAAAALLNDMPALADPAWIAAGAPAVYTADTIVEQFGVVRTATLQSRCQGRGSACTGGAGFQASAAFRAH